jgi:hypothetical protein
LSWKLEIGKDLEDLSVLLESEKDDVEQMIVERDVSVQIASAVRLWNA